MKKDLVEVKVNGLPICDECQCKVASYDGKKYCGMWAYMCDDCFHENGIGLGFGKGQRMVLVKKNLLSA